MDLVQGKIIFDFPRTLIQEKIPLGDFLLETSGEEHASQLRKIQLFGGGEEMVLLTGNGDRARVMTEIYRDISIGLRQAGIDATCTTDKLTIPLAKLNNAIKAGKLTATLVSAEQNIFRLQLAAGLGS